MFSNITYIGNSVILYVKLNFVLRKAFIFKKFNFISFKYFLLINI